MSKQESNSPDVKKLKELKELKRKNRRQSGMLLIAALQVTSLVVCYYLGRSSNR